MTDYHTNNPKHLSYVTTSPNATNSRFKNALLTIIRQKTAKSHALFNMLFESKQGVDQMLLQVWAPFVGNVAGTVSKKSKSRGSSNTSDVSAGKKQKLEKSEKSSKKEDSADTAGAKIKQERAPPAPVSSAAANADANANDRPKSHEGVALQTTDSTDKSQSSSSIANNGSTGSNGGSNSNGGASNNWLAILNVIEVLASAVEERVFKGLINKYV